jgi:membrane-bound serine protease (ClpP class)
MTYRHWRICWFGMLLGVLLGGVVVERREAVASEGVATRDSLVVVAQLQGEAITPVTVRHLERVLAQAERARAQCMILQLDTPGGLVDSTSVLVKKILNSRVPVVVYVSPQGARAASAGGFILLSSHVAAMSRGTRVGAMHPVQIGGLPIGPPPQPALPESSEKPEKPNDELPKTSTPSEQKIVNDTVAWARGLAMLRGRNVAWAEQAVRESVVATEQEALDEGIIDLIATDLADLLRQLDGRTIVLHGETLRLDTAQISEIRRVEMWWGDKMLAVISSPNVAFLLLIFGFYGILFELYTPGWGVAGMLGAICLVLAFMGLAVLPINYVGLALILLGLSMLVAEAVVTSFGTLTIGGLTCLVMGGLMLVDSPEGFLRVSLSVVLPVAIATAAITLLMISVIVRAYRGHVQTGSEGLVGLSATASDSFIEEGGHFAGLVQVHGELWRGVSQGPVAAGETIKIRRRDGLTLHVETETS